MINKWISDIKSKLLPSKIAGVEILFKKERIEVSGLLLSLEKGNINVENSFSTSNNLEDFLTQIPKDYPIALIVNGKGVLHKTILETLDINQAINQLFPNIKKEDFYFQQTSLQTGSVISIAKRSLLKELKQKINAAKRQLLSFSIGAYDMANLSVINKDIRHYQGLGQELELNVNGQIISFKSLERSEDNKKYDFENLEIDQNVIAAFATGVNHLLDTPSKINFQDIAAEQKEYLYSQVLRLAVPGILGIFLFILAVNTFFYYQLKDSTETGRMAMVAAQQRSQEVKDKRKALEQQTNLFNKTGANSVSSTSFFADRIGELLPKSIQFTGLEIFPSKEKKKNRRSKELIQYDPSLVEVRGICKSSQEYNDWLGLLESEKWIQSVRHENFRDLNSKVSEFLLTIVLETEDQKLGFRNN